MLKRALFDHALEKDLNLVFVSVNHFLTMNYQREKLGIIIIS